MTREEAIKLHKEKIWRNSIGDDKWKIEDLVNVIFDEHEAELKARNDRIETQKQDLKDLESYIEGQIGRQEEKTEPDNSFLNGMIEAYTDMLQRIRGGV